MRNTILIFSLISTIKVLLILFLRLIIKQLNLLRFKRLYCSRLFDLVHFKELIGLRVLQLKMNIITDCVRFCLTIQLLNIFGIHSFQSQIICYNSDIHLTTALAHK